MIDISAPQVLGILAALVVTVAVVESLRRGIVAERFAVLWIVVSVVMLVLAIFPSVGFWITDLLGVSLPANLLFFAVAMLLLLVSVQFSYEIGKLHSRTRRLAEDVALLQAQVDELRPGSSAGPADGR